MPIASRTHLHLEDRHYNAVERAVRLALDILKSQRPFDALVRVGTDAVESWGRPASPKWREARRLPTEISYPTKKTKDKKYQYQRPSDSEMAGWAHEFLRKLSSGFVPVQVHDIPDEPDDKGVFVRGDWVPAAEGRCTWKYPTKEEVMHYWEPQDAGVMGLNSEVGASAFDVAYVPPSPPSLVLTRPAA